jgi:hypothetical protein
MAVTKLGGDRWGKKLEEGKRWVLHVWGKPIGKYIGKQVMAWMEIREDFWGNYLLRIKSRWERKVKGDAMGSPLADV